MLKPRLRTSLAAGLLRASPAPASRSPFACAAAVASIHQVQKLHLEDHFAAHGVYKLYTAPGFEVAWKNYQSWCIHQLNQEIAGTSLEQKSVLEIAKISSREAPLAATFNYASMAYNNNFFFESITSQSIKNEKTGEVIDAPPYADMPDALRAELELSFGSLDNLRTDMLGQAQAMFGPGFVWLVRARNNSTGSRSLYRVLSTYLAGSPFPEAHWRKQGMDMNSVAGLSDLSGDVVKRHLIMMQAAKNTGTSSTSESSLKDGANTQKSPNYADVAPVLCVNTWEHAWMFDWGVGFKRNYLEAWWNAINWGTVAERVGMMGKRQAMTVNPGLPVPEPTTGDTSRHIEPTS